jgi:UPF0716 family protein affecting phage T7 exclusion
MCRDNEDMLKWLVLSAVVLVFGDPYLLYCIYDAYGFWPAALVHGGPIVVGGLLLPLAKRSMAGLPADGDMMGRFAEIPLLFVCNMMLWFPGPITSVLGLLLLVGPLRRIVARKLAQRMLSGGGAFSAFSSAGGPMGGMGGVQFGGAAPSGYSRGADNLKRAEGTTHDVDQPALPETDPKAQP